MTVIITKIIIVSTIIIKCRGRSRTPTKTNTKFLVTLYKGLKALTNTTKSSTLDFKWVLHVPLKRLIHII